MPRPRTITDESLLEAALAILHQRGPGAVTFAAVSGVSGLAPATLVQRFGSKDGLLEAVLLHAWNLLDARTDALDAELGVEPAAAVRLLVALSSHGDLERYADGLLVLREDFRNSRLRERGTAWGERLSRMLGRRLTADPAREAELGRLMLNQWQGVLLWWGFSRNGSLERQVAAELAAFLAALSISGLR